MPSSLVGFDAPIEQSVRTGSKEIIVGTPTEESRGDSSGAGWLVSPRSVSIPAGSCGPTWSWARRSATHPTLPTKN